MKKKVEYLILAGIIVTAVAYLILREKDRTRYTLPELPETPAVSLTRVEIEKGKKTVSLSKKEDRWYVLPGDFPADKEKASGIVDAAAKLSLAARVSESQNYARYDLDDEKRIHVRAFAGDAVKRDFEIGSTPSTFRHTHVKIAGDPNVYQALGNFKSKFDQTAQGLRDLTVLSFKTEDIRELSIHLDDKSVKILKKTRTEEKPKGKADTTSSESQASGKVPVLWEAENGKSVDEAKMKRILSTLSGLKCESYMEGFSKEDLKNPEMEIAVRGDAEYVLSLFKKTDKDAKKRPCTSSDNAYPFFLADNPVQEFWSFAEDLLQAK